MRLPLRLSPLSPRSPTFAPLQLEGYLIRDEGEVALKSRRWEEMNKEYLEEQAAKQAAKVRVRTPPPARRNPII
jgi:hypothetical protein